MFCSASVRKPADALMADDLLASAPDSVQGQEQTPLDGAHRGEGGGPHHRQVPELSKSAKVTSLAGWSGA